MAKIYHEYFDIKHMVDWAEENKCVFCIAVSDDDDRGCGKTYSTAKLLYNRYFETGGRFALFTRKIKQLGGTAQGLFTKYLLNDHPGETIYEIVKEKGTYTEIWLKHGEGEDEKKEIIGYTLPLKSANEIKFESNYFSGMGINIFWMDEFMPVDNNYLPEEVTLMRWIYESVDRDITNPPIILTANCITLGNPYFSAIKNDKGQTLNQLLQPTTREMKCSNFIYENVIVEGLAQKHADSGIRRALGVEITKDRSNIWINDNNSLVCKPDSWGHGRYVCTLKYKDMSFGVLDYASVGLMYVTRKVEKNSPYVYMLTTDGDLNLPLLRTSHLMKKIRSTFFEGNVRVSDGNLQRVLMEVFGV